MSMYKGTIQHFDTSPKGKLTRKQKFKVLISHTTTRLNVRFRFISGLKGTITSPESLGCFVKRLSVRHVFFAAVNRIFHRYNGTLDTAPADTYEADTMIKVDHESRIAADPVAEVEADKKTRVSRLAKLVAYARAPFVYIMDNFMSHVANVVSVAGAVAKSIKTATFKRKSLALRAEAVLNRSRDNEPQFDVDFKCATVPGTCGQPEEDVVDVGLKAEVIPATVADVGVRKKVGVVAEAGLLTWFLPEYENGTLTIFQTFSGVQSGKCLEVDLEEDGVCWANAFNQNGVLSLVFAQTEPQTDNELKVI